MCTQARPRTPRPKPVPATDAVRAEWLRRVEAEYRSAAITQHLTLWLIQIGASPDLVRAGLRIASDELAHAEMSHLTFSAAGGEGAPRLMRETLELARNPNAPLELDVARAGVEIYCLGETVAVPLFKDLREGCRVPVARRALDRILRDEVRHRDFGWALLGWLVEQPIAADVRALVAAELPRWFKRLRGNYAPPAHGPETAMSPDERAWGLMPISLYRAAVEKTIGRDWEPRFAKVGIDARSAWAASG